VPETWPVGLLLLSGLASVSANLLLIFAYRMMAGAVLAPLVYFQLIAAAAYGYIVWGSVPDLVSIAGLVLLLVSGFGSLALRRPA
jgi:drug/metabolite transporter (DMT)-like permease